MHFSAQALPRESLLCESRAQQYIDVINRIASALEKVTLVGNGSVRRQRPPLTVEKSSGLGRMDSSATTMQGAADSLYESPLTRHAEASGASWKAAGASAASVCASQSGTGGCEVDIEELCIPMSCGQETVAALSAIGHQLKSAIGELQAEMDSQLVALFRHTRKEKFECLVALHEKKSIVPAGFCLTQEGMKVPEETLLRCVSSLAPTDIFVANSTYPLPGATLPRLGNSRSFEATTSHIETSERKPAKKAPETLRNAPLARQLANRRSAATTLQTFLHLLLESAMTKTNATCAAVYLNDVPTEGAGCGRSTQSNTRSARGTISAKEGDTHPRFLHCVVHLGGQGKLPMELSYSCTSPVTAVVQTGIAVNLRGNTVPPTAEGMLGTGNPSVWPGAPAHTQVGIGVNKMLNIRSGIIVPIRDIGCVLIADKRIHGVWEFNPSDEYIAWGVATLCDALLLRYPRELLLNFSWSSSVVSHLQPFTSLPDVRQSHQTTRHPGDIFTEQFNGLLRNVTGDSKDTAGTTTKMLTVVRTSDDRTCKAIPVDFLSRNKHNGTAKSMVELQDDDIFISAAQYITNLETLWRQTLTDNNALQTAMTRYVQEMEAKQDRIHELEGIARRLNTRVVQLERSLRRTAPQAVK